MLRYGWPGSGLKAMLRSVRPSVRLSRLQILSRSLDGGMRLSPLQTYSKGGSTVGFAGVQMLSVGSCRFAVRHLDKLDVKVKDLKPSA